LNDLNTLYFNTSNLCWLFFLILYFLYFIEDLWNFQRMLCKDYYPIYKLWCGPFAFVSIHHPDDVEVKEILKDT